MKHTRPARPSNVRSSVWMLGAALLAACSSSSSSDSDDGKPHSADQSTVIGGPIEILERFIASLADEASTAGGTDFNGDGDMIDAIAVVTNTANQVQRVLNVAASDFELVRTGANGTHLFLVVDEALDGFDWDGDLAQDDLVLLHTDVSTKTALVPVATLGDDQIAKFGDRVYFQEDSTALVAPETSLMFVDTAAPTVPVRVLNADLANTLAPEVLAIDEGLLFLSLDEATELRDLNGDADMVDTDVLALLDAGDLAAPVIEVGLALQDDSTPLRALDTGPTWAVAFLVDETQQGAVNLNDPALFSPNWKAPQCLGFEDADTTDQVLHFLDYTAFVLDPLLNPPVNTGLVGDDRVLAVESGNSVFVATVSAEADEGTCNLNGDSDTLDDVLRWTEAVSPILPYTNVLEIQALASPAATVTSENVAELSGRFVAVISESNDERDHDDDNTTDSDLVAWLDPGDGNSAKWEFDHTGPGQGGISAVGTGWFDVLEGVSDRVGVAFPEAFFLNQNGNPLDINGDGDTLDSVPTFMRFNSSGNELDFPGPAVAVAAANAGIAISGNIGFYRVDEAADDRDWNQDGDETDFVLFRTTVSTLQNSVFISTLNNLAMPAVAVPDPSSAPVAVAFLADEAAQTEDFNNDGDTNDHVLRWFRVD